MILPLAFPAVVAGSIFTFSLTLGDFIAAALIVRATQFIGNVVFTNFAATTCRSPRRSPLVPVVVMIVYLLVARRLGAFEHV